MFCPKRKRRWREHHRVEFYSTEQLQSFAEAERQLINRRAPRLWEHIRFEALLSDELARRKSAWLE